MRGLIVLLALLGGCASEVPETRLPTLRLPPAAFAGSVSLTQRLSVSALPANSSPPKTLDALLEISPEQVQLAGFALGQRILTVSWDGQSLTSSRHALLPKEVDEQRVLRDVQLVYWPLATIQAALPAGWTLSEEGGIRTLTQGQQTIITIRYHAEPRWTGQADIENTLEHYRLVIDSKETP
ncbi:DUF3261 domain-containing protein [Iodobacter fluviatilis]|uniref:Protein of uncharacterized function (DUF3261) n=1 Tax=Iodobacter fluviatilis TaxID=537 RepID=A0A377Q949_9NEIS|nr:DUF3261 domain-containing protein [Iodobacter fluviatilis]TCU88592.1 uncharacterized protein DUF3261 [Iodobacter fluviatilis]STQ91337.1 Protein of uncharacterised function (DUF3261) [Iodobacter fluviatilis]